ncbi:MAG: DNA-binding transcriptional regulator, partial [Sedimentisphaerales bacterium]|nr:DNA-binding transcriptional regulator [Sedimentisphaerales bacterium]
AREIKAIDHIIDLGLPTIIATHVEKAASRRTRRFPWISVDNAQVGAMAAGYLLERGFKNFAFCGYDELGWSRQRAEHFAGRLRRQGYEPQIYSQPAARSQRFWDYEQPRLVEWLGGLTVPTGLMACTDDRAQQVIEACKIAGLHVPDDIAVMGVDDDKLLCNLCNPPITSVALAIERAGYEAAELLDRLMAGEAMAGQKIVVPPTHVVQRHSTDLLLVDDRDVARALRFIQQHCRQAIRVDDVADDVALSRRVLEKRFRRVLNHSILEMIRQARTERVAQMLLETNLSVSDIARATGYPSVKHVSRSFRKEKGMTPLAYRKKYGHK